MTIGSEIRLTLPLSVLQLQRDAGITGEKNGNPKLPPLIVH
jgi:hypothetical protein